MTEAEFRHFQQVREGYWRPRCMEWAQQFGRSDKLIWLPNYLPKAMLLDEVKRDPRLGRAEPASRRGRADRHEAGRREPIWRCANENAGQRWVAETERGGKPVLLKSVLDRLGRGIREKCKMLVKGGSVCLKALVRVPARRNGKPRRLSPDRLVPYGCRSHRQGKS